MDFAKFERAVEHLLALHARAEARMEKAEERMEKLDARMEKAEERMDRADARMDRFDKQLEVTRKLVQAGAKIVVENLKAQRRTEQRLDRLIQSWNRQGGNGRPRSV
jgi:septal ring factor EnvC (AmiA/AmiB activator)